MGYNLIECDGPEAKIDENFVGYYFSNHDENTIASILGGYNSFGATDNYSYKRYS